MEYKTETRYDGNGQPYDVRIPVLSKNTSPIKTNADGVFPSRTPVQIAESRDNPISPTTSNNTTVQNPTLSPEDLSLRSALEDKMAFDAQSKDKNVLSEEEYRNQAIASLQAEIDAQNKVYADKIARAKVEGQNRLGQEGAIQARRGLLGSDFGVASTNEINQGNTQIDNSLENELNQKLEEIRTGARKEGTAKFEAARKAKEEGLNAYIADLQNRATVNAGIADKIALEYLAKGINPTDDKNYLEQIAKEAGITSGSIIGSYKTKLSEKDKKDIELAKAKNEQYGTGAIGEYNFAKANGYTGSFSQYQNEDANRKLKATGVSALTANQVNQTVNQIAGAFDNEPVVKNYNVIAEGKAMVDSLPLSTKNPADDQALIYGLAKALDPNSVVREGEYATAQKYAQSWIKSFGKSVSQALSGTGFLSEEARKNIKDTINSKYESSKKNYDNVSKEYQRQIDDAYAGNKRTITNYGNAFKSFSVTDPNGATHTFDSQEKLDAFKKAAGLK